MKFLICRVVAFAALGLAAVQGVAQVYPSKPVRVIVPFPAGGGNDVTARLVGAKLAESLGQPFLVENRAGAGGTIGIEAAAKSAPDGYTLLVVPQNLVINPSLLEKVGFDPRKDFAPIAILVDSPVMIGVHAAVPVNSLRELIAHAKASGGKLNYTSCGTGSPQHLAGELMKALANVSMQHIPYGGCAPAVADVAAGRVEVLFATISHIVPHHKAGRMRGLATTGTARSSLAPEFPTAIEAGIANFDFNVWFGLLAPARTPREIVLKLNAEVNKTLEDPAIRAQFEKQNFVARGGTPDDFAKVIDVEFTRFAKLIRDVGIKP